MCKRLTVILVSLAASTVVALSQGNSPSIIGGVPARSSLVPPPSPPQVPISTIEGAPFSAEMFVETVRFLPDGSHISQRNPPSRIYRDSKGRVRYDRPERWYGIATYLPMPPNISIYDPVAKLQYWLDPIQQSAHASTLPEEGFPRFRSASMPFWIWAHPPELPLGALNLPGVMLLPSGKRAPFQPQVTEVLLGARQIEGVAVEGRRVINTTPVGWNGFERSIDISVEVWVSKDMDCLVSWAMFDPRVGESTWKLLHIERSEPEVALFTVPPNFTIVRH